MSWGQKIHESIISAGAEIDGNVLRWSDDDKVRALNDGPMEYANIPKKIADSLRSLFPAHEGILKSKLKLMESSEKKKINVLLDHLAKNETKNIIQLIKERIKEIQARRKEKDDGLRQTMLTEFTEEEKKPSTRMTEAGEPDTSALVSTRAK